MDLRELGNTGLHVSQLAFGAGQIGDASTSEKDVEVLLNSVLDLGINLIDTARSYGLSEERIGRHLKHRRGEFILSTKIGYGIPGIPDWTGPCITAGVDAALTRLQTGVIDIVHLHSCPLGTLEAGEVVEALIRSVEAGKVRVAAYSGDNEPLRYAISSGRFSSIQASLNVCDQKLIDSGLTEAQQRKLGVIVKRSTANAPWRFETQPPAPDLAEYWSRWREMALDVAGSGPLELALRFAISVPGAHCCLIGTNSVEHLRQNAALIQKGLLPGVVYEQIRAAFRLKGGAWTSIT